MCRVQNSNKMSILNQNPLHKRRRCFRFSYTTILYILTISIEISLCSARPNQDNTSVEKIEETDAGVFKATQELPSSFTTELYFENEKYPDTIEDEIETTDEGDDDEPNCDDEEVEDERCNEHTDPPNIHQPYKTFTESKFESRVATLTTQPQSTSTTTDETPIDTLHNDPMTSTTQAQSVTSDKEQLDPYTSTTEKPLSSTIFTVSIGNDNDDSKNVKAVPSKGSTLTNCSFILFTVPILLYFL